MRVLTRAAIATTIAVLATLAPASGASAAGTADLTKCRNTYGSRQYAAPGSGGVQRSIPNVYLRQGSTGSCVRYVQWRLWAHYQLPSSFIDGQYGGNTATYVRKWQNDVRISADGIVGPDTWYWLIVTGA